MDRHVVQNGDGGIMISVYRSSRKGLSLVEIALLLPVLLLLAIVTFDIGRTTYYYSVIHNASTKGARYGTINPEDISGIVNVVRESSNGLDPSNVSISVCECGGTNACPSESACPAGHENSIRVKVSYNFQLFTPLANVIMAKDHFSLASVSYLAIMH
jgi:Flp pilus assembly protein TadG